MTDEFPEHEGAVINWHPRLDDRDDLVLYLTHGRLDPEVDMEDWGFNGPMFRCEAVHVTYLSTLRVIAHDGEDVFFRFHDDMIFYDGAYYGDWTILSLDRARRVLEYDERPVVPIQSDGEYVSHRQQRGIG